MKTSMAYRLYRLYFNSNADNHALFGNRVHNPINGAALANRKDANQAAVARIILTAAAVTGLIFMINM